ncbi:MAG: hypothetical protein O3A47_10405, partial [Chloroflexi bacterium]|nr:hypothetical protein [Chloroflexota bacterium]
MKWLARLAGGMAGVAVALPVHGQELLYEIIGRGPSLLSGSVAPVGDVTGDGLPEFVFGAYGPLSAGGMVALVDGLTGVSLHSILGPGD